MGRSGAVGVSICLVWSRQIWRENKHLILVFPIIISPQTVGVIVRLERENFHVLGMHGKVIECKPTALQKRRENRNTVALDADQNQIRRRDIVKVTAGPHTGRDGEIKHLYRSLVFLHSRMYTENGGIFVCKTRHLTLAGGNKSAANSISPMGGLGFMSPRIQSPMHPGGAGGRGGGGGGGGGRGGGGFRGGRGGANRIMRDREILGKSIKISGGSYKGAVGIVKDATDSTARVELHSSCQTISVDRNHIRVVGAPAENGSITNYGRTPARTPSYSLQTPVYNTGNKTPMFGGQTPQFDAGSRTPYGSMTPMQDGGQTPRGHWDPNVSNTPARSSDFEYNMDQPTPSPSYNASTPSYPMTNSQFTPHTPGGTMYGSDHSYSPYQPSPSPSPSAYQMGSLMGTPSPAAQSPNTPGAPYSPYNPQTPGAGLDSQLGDWCTTDIEVKIRSNEDSGLAGQIGVVRTVNNGICSVFLPQEDRSVSVESVRLEPVQPEPGDDFKVIMGDDRESTGKLQTLDGSQAICHINGLTTYKDVRQLCKMKMLN